MGLKKKKAGDERTGDTTVRQRSPEGAAEMPTRYAASIVIRKGHKKSAEYSLATGRAVIGRDPGADIIIDDPAVSRFHAAVEFTGGGFVLKDLDSTNGTLMGGTSIKETRLTHGDTFQIGDTVLEFVLAEQSGRSVYVIE